MKIGENATGKNIVISNTPASIAGGSIWLALRLLYENKRLTMDEKNAISKTSGVSIVTLEKVQKNMYNFRFPYLTTLKEIKELKILNNIHKRIQ